MTSLTLAGRGSLASPVTVSRQGSGLVSVSKPPSMLRVAVMPPEPAAPPAAGAVSSSIRLTQVIWG